MNSIEQPRLRPIQDAWEALSTALRNYVETRLGAQPLFDVDVEEAVGNVDRAFEQNLEKFHTFYDLTKRLSSFDYFGCAATSLVLVLRNAIHHRDHELFVSWNRAILLEGGLSAKAGAAYLVGSQVAFTDRVAARFAFRLHDFYRRLDMPNARIQEPQKLRNLWDSELAFKELRTRGEHQKYPDDQIFVDVMPILMAAMAATARWLDTTDFTARGYDGKTYLKHFGALPADYLGPLDTFEKRIPGRI